MILKLTGIQIRLINKLHRGHYYGGKHTELTNLQSGFPSHIGKREIKEAINDLVSKGFAKKEPKTYELHISLLSERGDDIKAISDWYVSNTKRIKDHYREMFDIEL